MDNDFKRSTPRPTGQNLRPMQPMQPRSPGTFNRPQNTQPRPAAQQPLQPSINPSPSIQPKPVNPSPAVQPIQQPPYQKPINQQPAQATPIQPQAPQVQQANTPVHNTNSFTPPKKEKKPNRFKKVLITILPILIIVAAIVVVVLYVLGARNTVSEQETQIETLKAQLRSAQQTNLDLNRQIATLPGITIGLTQAEQNNVTAAVTSGNYAALKPFFIENTLVILAASDGIGRRSPEQAVKDLDYLNEASQPWNFSLDSDTLDNYRDGDYAQYFPEGAIIGRSADGKVVSLSTTTTGQISVVFMSPDEALL